VLAGFSIEELPSAKADTTVILEGVTFSDGGTASGYFTLNTYGYLDAADIITTPGTSSLGVSLPGFTYDLAGGGVPPGPAPFDSVFYFNSTVDDFSLILSAQNVVTEGVDPLILGSGSGDTLAGSYEYCTENPTVCAGADYLDGRLVTTGFLYAPEPATLSLLGLGAVVVPLLRRRRSSVKSGAA
jgi:hypothetical protein